MEEHRVSSKNLFNFPASGQLSEDILAYEAGKAALPVTPPSYSDDEFVCALRKNVDTDIRAKGKHPVLIGAAEDTVVTEFTVPTTHDGNYDVHVLVHTPKSLEGKSGRAAYVYAHGGGAIASSAVDAKPWMNYYAASWEVVCFNVEYRLAPETKCPNNAKDFYETIKYIHTNASSLGVDPNKICIAGDSGGGYICLSAMVLLAQRNETALVKLAIPGIPMVTDYCFSDPANMTQEERADALSRRRIWKLISTDLEKQRNDPALFPGKASNELLAKFPATVILVAEFDRFVTESRRLAARLRRLGRLLEFVVIPGGNHSSYSNPGLDCFKVKCDVMEKVLHNYLQC